MHQRANRSFIVILQEEYNQLYNEHYVELTTLKKGGSRESMRRFFRNFSEDTLPKGILRHDQEPPRDSTQRQNPKPAG